MLSVIIPAYNEELSVDRAYYTISEILEKNGIDNEIIFIDDGSSDDTYKKIKNNWYQSTYKNIKINIKTSINIVGKGNVSEGNNEKN